MGRASRSERRRCKALVRWQGTCARASRRARAAVSRGSSEKEEEEEVEEKDVDDDDGGDEVAVAVAVECGARKEEEEPSLAACVEVRSVPKGPSGRASQSHGRICLAQNARVRERKGRGE